MCKINDYIDLTLQYVNTMLDLNADIIPLEKDILDLLPPNITNSYHFYKTNLLEREVTLVYCIDSSAYTPGQMLKQKELIERKTHHPVIFIFDRMASYNIQRLARLRVNFIVPQKQMFIPDLLVDLKPQKNTHDSTNIQIPAIAQCIILYHLEVKKLNGKGAYEIADIFKVSYANVNRAIRWLEENGVINLSGIKAKTMTFYAEKRQLWETTQPLLINPVERIAYTDMKTDDTLFISGINALSEYSMINREETDCYAVSKDIFRKWQLKTDKRYGTHRIEVWRYNPGLLSKNGVVDRLSLYLALKDTDDERVQIELENMINNIVW